MCGRTVVLGLAAILIASGAHAQDVDRGRQVFAAHCVRCHGADGTGGEMGPAIATRLPAHDDAALAAIIRSGVPGTAMPANALTDREMADLVRFLRSIQREPPAETSRQSFRTTSSGTIEAHVIGEGFDDLQVRTADGRVHLLRREADRVREVTSQVDWPTYNGGMQGNRYTRLTEIDKANVARLAPKWMFAVPGASSLQVTPIVVQGLMYVTAPNEVFALDAGSGRLVWHSQQPRTHGPLAGGHANRGAAIAGNRVFMETDNAHVIALDRESGALLWDTEMADWHLNYAASSAPLPVADLVIAGVSGGEHGANGFVAAYDQATGKEVWRFSTVPAPGTPAAATWHGQGPTIDHGGAPTWFTGSYDPELDTIYWPVGNPSKEYNGDDRQGDDLYSDCILALDRKTGALKWFYQFTPHDLWDWDSTETSMVVDANWQGQPRKLLFHADRNGFFYVFDRTNGALLLAKPFLRHLTWATGIGADGRPIRLPNQTPTPEGTHVCPSQDGATNWFSPSFDPVTGTYFLQTFEKCSIYTKLDTGPWQPGQSYLGGEQRVAPDPVPARVLKAIDVHTGAIKWELPQHGPAVSWGGTIATASGLVFVGEDGGAFMAVDAATGRPLWRFDTNETWRASPMIYEFDGHEHVAVAAGGTIIAFALQPRSASSARASSGSPASSSGARGAAAGARAPAGR